MPPTPPFPEAIWGRKICALISCYDGSPEQAAEVFDTIHRDLPQPLFEFLGPMPFPAIQSLFDPLLPTGLQWYQKGDFVKDLSDAAIDIHLDYAAQAPTAMSLMHLYPIDGAVQRVGKHQTAWNVRDATWSMVIAGIDPDPANAEAVRSWAKAYWQALHPHNMDAAHINFMMEEGDDRIRAAYDDNYERLVAIKTAYDPTNLFRVNQNIRPNGDWPGGYAALDGDGPPGTTLIRSAAA